ncbi:DUF5004 domain-containing protein [Prevotella sp. 10(H)]|uniref:DUF5004 domain-containing protein n=1 Tax=Prevotella sp. 10(H) TaxID=1158294 RepID=UPI0004A74591|nr:DUF5004 domain-containing protein [Prevotella sp. 10(H)]
MKVLLKHLSVLFLLTIMFSFTGCNDTDDGHFVEPVTLYEKVKGSWDLSDVLQIDELAITSGITPTEISLSGQLGFDSFNLALNVEGNNIPTTYSVSGTAPELFPKSGFWDMSSTFQMADGTIPVIWLYSDAAKTTLIGKLSVVSMPGSKPEMELKFTRSTDGIAYVSYQYKLIKKTEPNQ